MSDQKDNDQLEEKPKDREQRYRALFERTNDAVLLFSLDDIYIEVNQQAADLLGYSVEEIVGQPISDFTKLGEKADSLKKKDLLLAGQTLPIYERTFIKKDGTEFPAEVNIALVKNSCGNGTHVQAIVRDISERKKTEEEHREREKKFRLIYETSGDGIMTLEPPDWKFTSGNNKILEIFGVKDENEFLSLAPWNFSPEYQPDGKLSDVKGKEMIDIAIREGENFFEWTHKRIRGKEFYATVLLNKVESGEKVFLQARVNDITERKKAAEEILRLKEGLESQVAEKTKELKEKVSDLQRFFDATIERELRMKELYEENVDLKVELKKYRKN